MDFNHSMICVDKSGKANEFKYSIEFGEEDDFQKIIYRVIPADINTDDWFEFALVRINDSTGKIYAMNNNNVPELAGKGISEKLIEIAAAQFNSTIISSSNNPKSKKLGTEWRTVAANKVWDRLVANNKAKYDSQLDVYIYLS